MNDGLTHFLNQYIESNAPGYAVLLKGAWGSGKSFFIKKWMEPVKDSLYISLFGLKSATEIHEALRREFYPKLSKGSKYIDAFTKIVLKTDNLDLTSLVINEDKKIEGCRLVVFDDFERVQMSARECMGCINYFVEQCGLKVIIVSNEDKIQDRDFFEIKEKTVGREFELVPDIDSALESFLHGPNGIGTDDINLLEDLRPLIIEVFRCAGTNNLRVLRQALTDYDAIVRELEDNSSLKNKRQYPEVLRLLLGNLLAIYLEYKAGNRVFEDWKNAVIKKPEGGADQTAFIRKYNPVGNLSEPLFRFAWVDEIMAYQRRGSFDLSYLQGLFVRKSKSSWAQLDNFLSLESDEYAKLVETAWKSLKGRKITNISEVFHADYNLLRILHEELPAAFSEEDIIEQTRQYFLRDLQQIGNEQDLMEYRRTVYDRFRYYQDPPVQPALDKIKEEFAKLLQQRTAEVKNPLALLLESITDDTIADLEALLDKPVPDQSCIYDDSAIFEVVNPLKFARSAEKMSNAGRQELQAILQKHYRRCLRIANPTAFIQRYLSDVEVLRQAAYCMDSTINAAMGLDRANLRRFQSTLLECADEMEDIEFSRALHSREKETIAAMVDETFTRFTSAAGLTDYEIIFELWKVASGMITDSDTFRLEPDGRSYAGKWLKRVDGTAMMHMPPAIAEYFPKWLEGHYMHGMHGEDWIFLQEAAVNGSQGNDQGQSR